MTPLHRRALVLALPAAAALTLAACGGGGVASRPATATTPTPSMMPMPSATSAPARAPVATNVVTISNYAFAPAAITVAVGATVSWTNQDQDAHTVAFKGEAPSKVLQMGATYSRTFTTPGTYSYDCSIHPFMKGTVTVGG